MGMKIKHKVAWHDNNMKRNCQPKYCQSELIKSKQCSVLILLINHKKLGEEYGAFWWVGYVYSNYKWWQCKIQMGKWKKLPFYFDSSICMNMEM